MCLINLLRDKSNKLRDYMYVAHDHLGSTCGAAMLQEVYLNCSRATAPIFKYKLQAQSLMFIILIIAIHYSRHACT